MTPSAPIPYNLHNDRTWCSYAVDNLHGACHGPVRSGRTSGMFHTEQHADVERLPEVERLLTRAVREAANHNLADAIDAARSALASCPGVPALAQDVARIVAILEAL